MWWWEAKVEAHGEAEQPEFERAVRRLTDAEPTLDLLFFGSTARK